MKEITSKKQNSAKLSIHQFLSAPFSFLSELKNHLPTNSILTNSNLHEVANLGQLHHLPQIDPGALQRASPSWHIFSQARFCGEWPYMKKKIWQQVVSTIPPFLTTSQDHRHQDRVMLWWLIFFIGDAFCCPWGWWWVFEALNVCLEQLGMSWFNYLRCREGGEYFIKKTRRKEERWRGVGGALVREMISRSLAPDT